MTVYMLLTLVACNVLFTLLIFNAVTKESEEDPYE